MSNSFEKDPWKLSVGDIIERSKMVEGGDTTKSLWAFLLGFLLLLVGMLIVTTTMNITLTVGALALGVVCFVASFIYLFSGKDARLYDLAQQRAAADAVGKDKYLQVADELISKADEHAAELEALASRYCNDAYGLGAGTAKQSSWAIHGGLADAIAGPAAGVAVALDVQRQNAEAEREAEEYREEAKGLFEVTNGICTKAKLDADVMKFVKKELGESLGAVEIEDASALADQVQVEFSTPHVTSRYSLELGNLRFVQLPQIKDDLILDGSFHFIATLNGKEVGEGYWCPNWPLFQSVLDEQLHVSADFDFEKASLSNYAKTRTENPDAWTETSTLTLVPFQGKTFRVGETYTIKFEAYRLWTLPAKIQVKQ